MNNKNLQNFLMALAGVCMGYAAQKVGDPKNASWTAARSQIYSAGLQAASQELTDRIAKTQQVAAAPDTQTQTY